MLFRREVTGQWHRIRYVEQSGRRRAALIWNLHHSLEGSQSRSCRAPVTLPPSRPPAMEHLLNDAPPEEPAAGEVVIKNEAALAPVRAPAAAPPLPHLAAQLSAVSAASPSSSAASLGLHMLSSAPPAPPRLPPISLLTAAAAALQPMQCRPLCAQAPAQPQLRPMLVTPLQAAASSSSPAVAAPAPANDMLCRYRNKKCAFPRAIKRNGERHNLCERHRAKANQNQRKLESKRRTQKRMMQRAHSMGADRIVKAKKAAASVETEITFTLYGGAVA
ncbi:hypothetical protein PHYPSEUDO_010924 [Phytophthora pseudosyringae]|uniref:Uncharacterized protein n=1 Tax=Phytophthora pseudosyringae TaxID=221518 RepID=A0A8T1VCJ6_9STRA|nr:hypothetical protein PHYPSEUDO_010924 [Phytophthora pseudosyringae]